jgi:hypothetical protein
MAEPNEADIRRQMRHYHEQAWAEAERKLTVLFPQACARMNPSSNLACSADTAHGHFRFGQMSIQSEKPAAVYALSESMLTLG